MNEKLITFLYLLMRDHLPVGEVIKLINSCSKLNLPVKFTNKQLAEISKNLLKRLEK